MKTWWDYAYLIVFSFLIPLLGFVPMFQFKGLYIGGGIIRQICVNTIAQWLPVEKSQALVNYFQSASEAGEMLLYLPIYFNIVAVLVLISFIWGYVMINITNAVKSGMYSDQRQQLKR